MRANEPIALYDGRVERGHQNRTSHGRFGVSGTHNPKLRARIGAADGAQLIAGLRRAARVAADPPAPPPRSPDSGDDYLLALAESEHALVVSGDRHLLELAGELPVRSARAFLEALEARRPSMSS